MKKIIIIEDSELMRKFLEIQCMKIGEVVCYRDAISAYKDISINNIPDLIILDLNLPEFSGKDLLRKLYEIDLFRRIPILILSAETSISSKIECLELGASDYITKPFHPEELSLRVKNLINSSTTKLRS